MSVYSTGSHYSFTPQNSFSQDFEVKNLCNTDSQDGAGQSDPDLFFFGQPYPVNPIFTSTPPSAFAAQTSPTAARIINPMEPTAIPDALISILRRLREHTSQTDLKNTYYIDEETNEAFLTDVFQFIPLCTDAEKLIKVSNIAFETAYHMLVENFLEIFGLWKIQADTFAVSPLPKVCDLIFNNLEKFSLTFCTFIDATIQFDNKHLIFNRETPDQVGIRNLFWKKNWSGVVNKLKQLPKIPERCEEVGLISNIFARNVPWQELSHPQISAEIENCYYYPFVASCESSLTEVVQLLKGKIPLHLSPTKNLLSLRIALLLRNGAHGNQPVRVMLLNEWRQAAFKHLERMDLELKANSELTLKNNDLETVRTGEKRFRGETMTLEQEEPPNKIPNTMFFSMDTDGDVF